MHSMYMYEAYIHVREICIFMMMYIYNVYVHVYNGYMYIKYISYM